MFTTFNYNGTAVEAKGGIDGLFRTPDGRVFELYWDRGRRCVELLHEPKYFAFKQTLVELRHLEDGLWHSSDGTTFALTDDAAIKDPFDRCGVGVFSFPSDHPLTDACRAHDYMYSSPAFQLFHNRAAADAWLLFLAEQVDKKTPLPRLFYWISRIFGGKFWDNSVTNN